MLPTPSAVSKVGGGRRSSSRAVTWVKSIEATSCAVDLADAPIANTTISVAQGMERSPAEHSCAYQGVNRATREFYPRLAPGSSLFARATAKRGVKVKSEVVTYLQQSGGNYVGYLLPICSRSLRFQAATNGLNCTLERH